MTFKSSALVMAGKELVCIDKFRRPLVGGVQVVQNYTVSGRSQATLCCKVNCKRIAGLVEGMPVRIQLANSLNWLACQGKLLLQSINPITKPIKLPAGALVGEVPLHPRSGCGAGTGGSG